MILAIEWPHHSGEDQNRSDTIEIVRVAVSSLHAEAPPPKCLPSTPAAKLPRKRLRPRT
jgi:acyl-CoA synthetase (AMP-forming)/AMP-acid ligase II